MKKVWDLFLCKKFEKVCESSSYFKEGLLKVVVDDLTPRPTCLPTFLPLSPPHSPSTWSHSPSTWYELLREVFNIQIFLLTHFCMKNHNISAITTHKIYQSDLIHYSLYKRGAIGYGSLGSISTLTKQINFFSKNEFYLFIKILNYWIFHDLLLILLLHE